MRRAPIVIIATVLGTAGVLLFKPQTASSLTSTPSADPSSSAPSASGSASSGSASSSPSATPSSTPSASSSTSSSAKDGTYTGTAETVARFGTTQVKVTIAGGRITAVTVVEENTNDPRSTEISDGAIPILREEVLAKQTAAVDVVSGATYTSDQYEASLQSALDAAHFTAADGSKASTDISNISEGGGFHG